MALMAQSVFSQQAIYKSITECSDYNYFIQGNSINQLKYYADTVLADGTIMFNLEKSHEIGSLEILYPLLNVGENATFEIIHESLSRTDSTKKFVKYQHFYKGIKVDGSGFTLVAPADPNDDPCLEVYMLAPYILSNINIDINQMLGANAARIALSNFVEPAYPDLQVNNMELTIIPNILNDCQHRLIWEASYFYGGAKTSWIDAKTGQVLKTFDPTMFKNAPTINYGPQNMKDRTVGTQTKLESPDGKLKTYDFYLEKQVLDVTISDFNEALIPLSDSNRDWDWDDAHPKVYQAHYVTDLVASHYKKLNIDFENIHVGANCSNDSSTGEKPTAAVVLGSTLANAYLAIGQWQENPIATFDIIGHELGHVYLLQFLSYTSLQAASLHEGIADMLGIYIDYIQKNEINWTLGEDIPLVFRDLSLTNCFTNVLNAEAHERGKPLGHWFYLLTNGDPASGISALGIQKPIDLILDAVKMINNSSDYPQLMQATLTLAINKYGKCSNEFLSIARAWEKICVSTGYADAAGFIASCNYLVKGPNVVCEEDDKLTLKIEGGLPTAQYIWTIIGPNSAQWVASGNQSGNKIIGGSILDIIDFPKYAYYPRYFTIEAYSPTVGSSFIQHHHVKLEDCNHDDPTCEEANSFGKASIVDVEDISKKEQINSELPSMVKYVRVYDCLGRLKYQGEVNTFFDKNTIYLDGIFFCQYFDKNGKFVAVKKQKIIK